MEKQDLGTYKKMLPEMFKSVSQAIGIHVMLLVLEHALWQIRIKYEKASLIQFSEDGISLEMLETIDPEEAQAVAYEFIMAIINTLGRLVGMQLAKQLIEQLETDTREEQVKNG